MRRACVVWPAVAVLAAGAGAGEIWVDASADPNVGDGSPPRPYATIAQAMRVAGPGATVVVKAGVYRQAIKVPSGEPGRPLTIRAEEGRRVVVSGGRPVVGWRRHDGNVWISRLDFTPRRLFARGRPQPLARQPADGWWVAESATATSLTDPTNLKGRALALVGAEAEVWTTTSYGTHTAEVTDFDPSSGTVGLKDSAGRMRLYAGDRYYLRGAPDLISRPGEWGARDANGQVEVLYLPASPEDLAAVEAPAVREPLIDLSDARHVVLEGLEVCRGEGPGIRSAGGSDLRIVRCLVHDNSGGISLTGCQRVRVERCVLWRNRSELSMRQCSQVTVEFNEVRPTGPIGIGAVADCSDLRIRRNCVRGDLYLGLFESGGISASSSSRVRVEENLVSGTRQGISMARGQDGQIVGNTVFGCSSTALLLNYDPNGCEIRGNTLAFAPSAGAMLSGEAHRFARNVVMTGHPSHLVDLFAARSWVSDHNLFFASLIHRGGFRLPKGSAPTLADARTASSQDSHSAYDDPKFRGAPMFFRQLDGRQVPDCTAGRLFLRDGTEGFILGDTVEINLDQVPRMVTALGDGALTVAPPASRRPRGVWLVANWKGRADCRWDLRLSDRSPGLDLGPGGTPVGSSIDVQAYLKGDFDGDGRRDLPEAPD